MIIGATDGGNGLYELTGGTLMIPGDLNIGSIFQYNMGDGEFAQTGGYNEVSDQILLAPENWATGVYNLSGGVLGVDTLSAGLGEWEFNFTGGTLIPQTVTLGLENTGGLLHPAATDAGEIAFTWNGGYTQGSGGTLEITLADIPAADMDVLTDLSGCQLDGLLQVVVTDDWNRVAETPIRHQEIGTFINTAQISGDFSTFYARLAGGKRVDCGRGRGVRCALNRLGRCAGGRGWRGRPCRPSR